LKNLRKQLTLTTFFATSIPLF